MNISVAGVAEKNGRFLIALRKPGTSIGVKWEFPGGKMEDGESPEQALVREFDEELSVGVRVGKKLCEGAFSNGPKNYTLLAYQIELENEDFTLTEHQEIMWAGKEDLKSLEFPSSDAIILNYLLSR